MLKKEHIKILEIFFYCGLVELHSAALWLVQYHEELGGSVFLIVKIVAGSQHLVAIQIYTCDESSFP